MERMNFDLAQTSLRELNSFLHRDASAQGVQKVVVTNPDGAHKHRRRPRLSGRSRGTRACRLLRRRHEQDRHGHNLRQRRHRGGRET